MQEGISGRSDGKEREVLVISRLAEGFRVYSPAEPRTTYVVAVGPERSRCSCPDFENHHGGSGIGCKHIEAVERRFGNGAAKANGGVKSTSEATQQRKEERMEANGSSGIVIKRSVSPDGRIDSLSVEVGFSVESLPAGEIKARAEKAIKLQGEIVEGFLDGSKAKNGHEASQGNGDGDGALAAEIVRVGGMNGKWGRRLFLTVQTKDRNLRLFGNRKQLADFLTSAGFSGYEEKIAEGLELKVPCRVITKPSEDGNWLNIDRILPANSNGSGGNGR